MLSVLALLPANTAIAQSVSDEVTATATAEVCGDGLKVTTVVLTYPEAIDGARLDTATYQVKGRHVVEIHTAASAESGEQAETGPCVVLRLDRELAATSGMGGGMRRPEGGNGPRAGRPERGEGPRAGRPGGGRPEGGERPKAERPEGGDGPQAMQSEGGDGPKATQPEGSDGPKAEQTEKGNAGGGHSPYRAGQLHNDSPESRTTRWNDTVELTQVASIYTADGQEIAPMTAALTIKSERTLVADDFVQLVYPDPETGIEFRYNLFTPKEMKEGETYPLVLFMHDASGAGKTDTRHTLLQGNGATVWASPEWQAKHPCFVVAPQFNTVTVDDDFNASADLTACINLLDSLIAALPVDADRVYTTGQSMGCMMSYEFLYRRPDLFASAMLVAGQWDPKKMAPLSKMNLWLISCTGDDRSSAGVAAAKEIWQANGAMVVEQEWPLLATPEERARDVEHMLRRGGNIHYAHLQGGNHRLTWNLAYNFDGVREWLFQQRRPMHAADIQALMRRTDDPTLIVCAQDGDAHGTTPGGIHAIEKAVMKGALMARVAISETDGQLCLPSGQPLDTALDTIGTDILLLVDVQTEAQAQALEALAAAKGRKDQLVLYGSAHGTALSHIAHVDLDHGTLADVDAALAHQPLAVCLTYSDDANTLLPDAIARVKTSSRVCMDATQAGLAGSHGDHASRAGGPGDQSGFVNAWGALFDMGATVLITNQIKPILNRVK